MRFRKGRNDNSKDPGIILRSYIAQGIKLLYLDRKHPFSERNRDYIKLKEILEHISGEVKNMIVEKPRMLIPSGNGFQYKTLDEEMARSILGYMNFIVELPPPGHWIFSKWKKSVDIGMMRVPTLVFMLYSTLEYRIPKYLSEKIEDYACISAAILGILKDSSQSSKIVSIAGTFDTKMKSDAEMEKKVNYRKNIEDWIKLGLVI